MNFVSRLHREEQAQGVVEFALISVVLMLIALGTFDYARFLYYDHALSSAVRVGAEYASNHCPNYTSCGISNDPTPDSTVMWATYCNAQPYVNLSPSYNTCDPYQTATCSSGSCSNCSADICVTPSSRTNGTTVTVSAGYNFTPITFLMAPFFNAQSCFSGDSTGSNHHTLCASATGRVS